MDTRFPCCENRTLVPLVSSCTYESSFLSRNLTFFFIRGGLKRCYSLKRRGTQDTLSRHWPFLLCHTHCCCWLTLHCSYVSLHPEITAHITELVLNWQYYVKFTFLNFTWSYDIIPSIKSTCCCGVRFISSIATSCCPQKIGRIKSQENTSGLLFQTQDKWKESRPV